MEKPKNMPDNPWAGMPANSKRRIEEWSERNLFWVTDIKGSYGFNIRSSAPFREDSTRLRLKGIEIGKRVDDGGSDFFLVLNKNEDWQIFKILCSDLISVAAGAATDESMIALVEARLRRWQQLLNSDLQRQLSIETQMGLFSELLCLRDVVAPRIGLENAVRVWGGPDADKQDFVCTFTAIEVKSYMSSKGPAVTISSAQQLWSEKDNLILIAYGLSVSAAGRTIEDLFLEIAGSLTEEDSDVKEIFDAKVGHYGFIPEIYTGELIRFVVDKQRFYSVSQLFPRIEPSSLAGEIISVRYTIDLARCNRYQISGDELPVNI